MCRKGIHHKRLKEYNEDPEVTVVISTRDISNRIETKQLIQEATKLAPVGGIFHLAMVIFI